MLHALGRLAVQAFAPRRCAACEAVAESALCGECLARLLASPQPRVRALSNGAAAAAFEFGGSVRVMLHKGKYRGDRAALRALASAAAPRLIRALPAPDAVVALPLGAKRLRRRGYNQASDIAAVLAEALGTRVAAGLDRVRDTKPQAERDEAARRSNVAGAFAWRGAPLSQARLWLVDDVLTTGATSTAAVGTLIAAGATRVDVAVVAAVV